MPSKIINKSKKLSLGAKVHAKKDLRIRQTLRTHQQSVTLYRRKETLKKQLADLAQKSGLQLLMCIHDPLKGSVTQVQSDKSFDLEALNQIQQEPKFDNSCVEYTPEDNDDYKMDKSSSSGSLSTTSG